MQVPHPARARVPRRHALIALASAGALSAGVAATGATAPVSAAPGDTTVQILSFNDYHGHVQSGTPGSIDGSFRGPAAGGGEYLSAKLTELRDASTADASFTVAAGDLIGGSPFFSGLFHDEPSVESLNAMGLDFSGVGNHEFDEGVDELLRMQNGGNHPVDGGYFDDYDADTPGDQEFGGADFQWLAANVTEDAPDGIDDFEDSIPDYSIVEAADGKKVAFIGMTLEGTDELVAAAGIVGYTFEDEIAAGNAAVDAIQLEDPDVEAIVVMLHEGGIPTPFAINGCTGISGPIVDIAAGLSSEIDAIVTGHTHQPYTCSISDPDSNPRPVVSAFSFGRVVTEINLELDDDGEVDRDTFTMENHEVLQNLPTDDPEVFTDAATDSAVTDIIAKWTPLAEERGNDPVGEITETVTRGGVPTGADRGVESAAGNLVADAQLFATADDLGAQIAFMNAGGLRSDLTFEESDAEEGDGVVTYGEAFTFQPFNNTMFVLPMTGEQIIAVLVEQCQPGGNSRPVQHLGVSDGFTYDMDITLQDGVCTDIAVTNVQLDGVALDEAATYNVAVNNFLADGGDNFETFAEVAVTDRLPGPQDIDALISYFEDAGAPVAPPTTDRVNETITTLPASIASIDPARLLDTRTGENNLTVDGLFQGDDRVAAGGEIELQVSERGGVPSGVAAVVLNIGVINPTTSGFVTAYPCGTDRPTASNINFDAAATVSNAVFSGVGVDGTVCVYSSSEAHLIADALSFVAAGGTPVAVEPARLLETRTGEANVTVDTLFQGDGRIAAGNSIELTVAGRGGVPSDAEAVVVNIGAVRPSENGFLTVYACGTDRPTASSVNYVADGVVSNSTTVPVGIGGTVCVYSSAETHLIADVNAYVPVGGSPAGLAPARLLDTRVGDGNVTIDNMFEGVGPVGTDGIELTVAGRGGVPADASTVVLNVGAIRPAGPGFVTVYACGADLPTASNINYSGGDIVSNSVVAKIGDDGKVCIFSSVDTELIVDVTAAVTPPVPFLPADA